MSNPLLDPKTGKPFPSRKKDLSKLIAIVVHHGAAGTEKWSPETFVNHRHNSALEWQRDEKRAGRPGTLYAYSGPGYNAIVFPNGDFYSDVPLEEIAWSTGGLNSTTISICFAGDYTGKLPTEAALKTGEQILATWLKRYGADTKVIGHRDAVKYSKDATATSCPGNVLYGYLPELEKRARAYVK